MYNNCDILIRLLQGTYYYVSHILCPKKEVELCEEEVEQWSNL